MLGKKMVIIEKLWLLLQTTVFVNFPFPCPPHQPQNLLKQKEWFSAASFVRIIVSQVKTVVEICAC